MTPPPPIKNNNRRQKDGKMQARTCVYILCGELKGILLFNLVIPMKFVIFHDIHKLVKLFSAFVKCTLYFLNILQGIHFSNFLTRYTHYLILKKKMPEQYKKNKSIKIKSIKNIYMITSHKVTSHKVNNFYQNHEKLNQ